MPGNVQSLLQHRVCMCVLAWCAALWSEVSCIGWGSVRCRIGRVSGCCKGTASCTQLWEGSVSAEARAALPPGRGKPAPRFPALLSPQMHVYARLTGTGGTRCPSQPYGPRVPAAATCVSMLHSSPSCEYPTAPIWPLMALVSTFRASWVLLRGRQSLLGCKRTGL